jgi:hypothetical protein
VTPTFYAQAPVESDPCPYHLSKDAPSFRFSSVLAGRQGYVPPYPDIYQPILPREGRVRAVQARCGSGGWARTSNLALIERLLSSKLSYPAMV